MYAASAGKTGLAKSVKQAPLAVCLSLRLWSYKQERYEGQDLFLKDRLISHSLEKGVNGVADWMDLSRKSGARRS